MRAILISTLVLFSAAAWADIDITISGAKVRKGKLVVGAAHPQGGPTVSDPALAQKIQAEMVSDMEFANVFDLVPRESVAALDMPGTGAIPYEEWKKQGIGFYLRFGYQVVAGKLVVDAAFFDVNGEKRIFGTRYQFAAAQYYRLVHTIAEDIMQATVGERGLFLSRLLMVCQPAQKMKSPPKDIYIIDADGRNPIQLTRDKTISLSPSWAPDAKSITYTQYDWVLSGGVRKKGTVLKRHDLTTGRRQVLSSKDGMNSGASWKPDGSRIAMTLSFTGRPELYLLDPLNPATPEPLSRNIQWQKIGGGVQPTNPNLFFEVEPNWSPDGKQMVISSARTKHPMIYVVDMVTKAARQLTFAGIYNASPSWSPKGDKILFAAQ
ncbi:hypothetical protein K2X33_01840, partial [bacterium]|nr:hypothetical protein [bacterium]